MKYKKTDSLNIIRVSGDEIYLEKEDGNLEVSLSDKLDFYDISKMNIEVKKSTSLLITYKGKSEIKLDISITVSPNVTLTLDEIKDHKSCKIQEKFYLYDNTCVENNKFINVDALKELNIIYLNGVKANYKSNQKGIIKGKSKIDILVYHNYPLTNGIINNKFVTIKEGEVKLNTTSIVYKNRKECILSQNNHILNENEKESTIKPNLLIEENDMEANHSANIEPFKEELLFFMESRGIERKQAEKMLLKGFLSQELIEVDSLIEKYWG